MQRQVCQWLGTMAVAGTLWSASSGGAIAAEFHNGWLYAIDSFTDGVSGTQVGGNAYEIYGMAVQETATQLQVAINTNMPLEGVANSSATNGSISLGDIFFNFSNQPFSVASANGTLFAVRFAPNNDSGVNLGLYNQVKAKSVTATNSGFPNLSDYNARVTQYGGFPSMGDLAATDPYLDQTGPVLNVIDTGTYLSGLNVLDPTGLDFIHFGAIGSHTWGFSVDKSFLPSSSFIANFLAECANDSMALLGSVNVPPPPDPSSIPEPSMIPGLVAVGLIVGRLWLTDKKPH